MAASKTAAQALINNTQTPPKFTILKLKLKFIFKIVKAAYPIFQGCVNDQNY